MARSIQQITQELQSSFAPSIQALRQQKRATKAGVQGDIEQLRAEQQQAFGDILAGAKSRGLKFSGIPVSEQAEFTSTRFLPELTRLKGQANSQAAAFDTGIADILRQRGMLAQQLRQQELDRAASERAASRAAAAQQSSLGSVISSLFAGQGGGQSQAQGAKTPNLAQLRKEAKEQASQFTERALNSFTENGQLQRAPVLRILSGLQKRGSSGDLQAIEKYNALAGALNVNRRFNNAGKLQTIGGGANANFGAGFGASSSGSFTPTRGMVEDRLRSGGVFGGLF